MKNKYKRDTVTLNANLAKATHGETKQFILGGGNPSQPLQHFILKEKPLTYLSASTISGVKSSLEIRVDNILWKESSSLYSLDPLDRAYATQIDNELQTHIFFGDGYKGLRPTAGLDNITAKYRIGIGKDGLLKAGQINILMDMPLGVRGVTNPIPSTGAADPENGESARQNAPLAVLTMDRLVSLTDYENFAKAFQGIGKAQAIWIWEGEKRIVYLTLSSEEGTAIESTSILYQKLTEAIKKYKDPVTRFKIGTPEIKTFNIKAEIFILEGFEFENVKLNVEDALKHEFSFKTREFGQHVVLSEVFSIIQGIEGVDAVNIEHLYLTSDTSPSCQQIIPSKVAHWDDVAKKTVSAEMVILNSKSDSDSSMKRGLEIMVMEATTR